MFTKPVHDMSARPSLTKTVNKGFALTTVNTVNAPFKSLILHGVGVDDDC